MRAFMFIACLFCLAADAFFYWQGKPIPPLGVVGFDFAAVFMSLELWVRDKT